MKVEFKKKIDVLFWPLFFCGMILISAIVVFFATVVLNNMNIGYYVNYVLWISLFLAYIVKEKKLHFEREYIAIFLIVFLNTIIGAICGKCILNLKIDNLHQGILMGVIILIVMGINWNNYLKSDDILTIMKVIFLIGIAASLYAMIVQRNSLVGVIFGGDRGISAWTYRSFFSTRNVFAYYCFLSSIAGVSLLYFTKHKRYLIGIVILAIQMYITDSRTAMLAVLLFYSLCVYLNMGKSGKIILSILCVGLFIGILMFGDSSAFIERFYHESGTSFGDSGSLRLEMWYSGIKCLIENNVVISGLGFGSQAFYLLPLFNLGSFHNAYMDIFFQGGLILLGIYLHLIFKVFKSIFKIENRGYRYISIAFVVSYLFGCLFDSSAMLFSSNFEAIPATLMVCILAKAECKTTIN